jgi:hypothetical protein
MVPLLVVGRPSTQANNTFAGARREQAQHSKKVHSLHGLYKAFKVHDTAPELVRSIFATKSGDECE